MTHGEKKIGKIIEELTMYFFAVGANKINSGIEINGNQAVIHITANYLRENADRVEKLREYLNEPKNNGLENFFWELAGCGDPGESSQLILLGMMIDSFEMEMDEEKVSLVLYKELESGI